MHNGSIDLDCLGWQLTQQRGGVEAAGVLKTALALRTDDLDRVAALHPGPVRTRRWDAVVQALPDRCGVSGLTTPTVGWSCVQTLVRVIRDEILGWTWEVTDGTRWQSLTARAVGDVVVDAFVACYAGAVMPAKLASELGQSWRAAIRHVGDPNLGPNRWLVSQELASLDVAGPGNWSAPGIPADAEAMLAWSQEAADDARWAVRLTDRGRCAAIAQLLAVQSVARHGPLNGGHRVQWHALSRYVEGLVVQDVIATDTLGTLRDCWRAAASGGRLTDSGGDR